MAVVLNTAVKFKLKEDTGEKNQIIKNTACNEDPCLNSPEYDLMMAIN